MLELRASPRGTARRLYFEQLGYCDAHKKSTTIATFLSEEGWDRMAKTLREAGKERIDRRSTTLAWELLTGKERQQLGRSQHRTTSPKKQDDDADLAF